MYDLAKAWDSGLRLTLQRRNVYLHRLVFFAGVVFLLAGGAYYFLGAAVDTAAVAFGSGIALVSGAFFLVEFYRGRPVAFLFDHDRRLFYVEEGDGTRAGVAYDRFRSLHIRRQSRRWIVYLMARDGSYRDLSAFSSRNKARELYARLHERLPLDESGSAGAQDPVAPDEDAQPGYAVHREGRRVAFWWRDTLTLRGSFYVLGLLSGFALAGWGLGRPYFADPMVGRTALAALGIVTAYVLLSIVKGVRQMQVIAVDESGLATGVARTVTPGHVPAFAPTRQVSREDWTGVWYSFDILNGLQRYLFPGKAARAILSGLYGDDTAEFSTAWKAVGVRFRTPQISLSGLSAADAIRLQDEIEQAMKPG